MQVSRSAFAVWARFESMRSSFLILIVVVLIVYDSTESSTENCLSKVDTGRVARVGTGSLGE